MFDPKVDMHLAEFLSCEERFNDQITLSVREGKTMICYCGNQISDERWQAGYHHCMACGDKQARQTIRTIVPLHKSNYIVVGDKSSLKGLNKNPVGV